MKAIKLMDVVKAVHAIDYTALDRFISVTGVEFDSRKVKPGDLFVPLSGGATDGHDYIQQAIKNGAVATLWSKEAQAAPADQIAIVLVDDTLVAMQALANYYRNSLNPKVIGITGSNGKTTTKDMTANVLKAKYKVHKTEGNYNNEIGLPYTLLQMPADTQVVVCEMGMSDFGEIEVLSKIAQPDIAVITLIGESHLEFLGSRANIAKAKLEILKGLKEDGLFIYPANEPLLQEAGQVLGDRARSFGLDNTADFYAYDLKEDKNKTYFHTNIDDQVLCSIPVMGAYNVGNAMIALTVAQELKVPIEQAIFQLSQFKLTKNRLEWLTASNGASILNDAYNASPTSIKAVLKSFSQVETQAEGRRLVALGDVKELGPESANYHAALSQEIDPKKIAKVYLLGPQMQHLYQALQAKFPKQALYYTENDHKALVATIQADLQVQDHLLVKSSLGTDMLYVVGKLIGEDIYNPYRTIK